MAQSEWNGGAAPKDKGEIAYLNQASDATQMRQCELPLFGGENAANATELNVSGLKVRSTIPACRQRRESAPPHVVCSDGYGTTALNTDEMMRHGRKPLSVIDGT